MTLIDSNAKDLFTLLVGILLSSELLIQLPLRRHASDLKHFLKKTLKILISAHISDRRKERMMLVYASKLCFRTLTIAAQMSMAFIPFSLALWLVTADLKEMVAASLDPSTILFTTMTSSIYLFFRTRRNV